MQKKSTTTDKKRVRPALTPEARENQMIAYAINLAEKQLIEGTASSQVITHFLKLGSRKERLEQEIREKEKELIEAKTANLKASQMNEEVAKNAIEAMKRYSGNSDSYEDDYF